MLATETRSYSLLITDDDDEQRDCLRMAFEPQGYETHVANCGLAAIRVATVHRIHVAIVDMQMPDLTGLETMWRIREVTHRTIPYVVISGLSDKELKIKALQAEAYTFITKPVSLDILRDIVAEIIAQHYAHED